MRQSKRRNDLIIFGSSGRENAGNPSRLACDINFLTRPRAKSSCQMITEQDDRVITLDVPGQLTLDDAGLTLEAVLAGTGLAYLAEWWIGESVREGKLRRVLEGFTPSSAGLSLYYPSRRYQPAGLRALISFIEEARRKSTSGQRASIP